MIRTACLSAILFLTATCHAVEFVPVGSSTRNAQAHTEADIEYSGQSVASDPDADSGLTSAYASSEAEVPGSAYAHSWSSASNAIRHSTGPPAWTVSCFGHYLGLATVNSPNWFAEAWAWHQTAISQTFRAQDVGTWTAEIKFSQTIQSDPDVVARYYMTGIAGRSEVTWQYDFILGIWRGSGVIWDVDAQGVEFSRPYLETQTGFEFEAETVSVSEHVAEGETVEIGCWINGDDPWDLSWLVAYLLTDALWASGGEDNESGYARHDVQVVLEDTP